ncbi:MAG: hypothetical protein JRH20_23540, partial [Deltaproteobacteria bacterium]|nr:hypothetical protein [Deltaproteobacteria bacterium]
MNALLQRRDLHPTAIFVESPPSSAAARTAFDQLETLARRGELFGVLLLTCPNALSAADTTLWRPFDRSCLPGEILDAMHEVDGSVLEELHPEAQELLATLALCTFPLPGNLLARVSGDRSRLEELLVRGLLSVRGGGLVPGTRAIGEAALQGRDPRWQRARHRELASTWHESKHPAAEGHHLLQAELWEAALPLLLSAPDARMDVLLALLDKDLTPTARSALIERLAP